MNREKAFAILRIIFGGVWAIDAYFKWSPEFLNNFTSYLEEGATGQSGLVQAWIHFWIVTVSVNPHLFGIIVAIGETAIAIGLVFGVFTRIAILGGIALAFVIWSTAEGFGGPYMPGSTDIGGAIIYVLMFLALWIGACWRYYSLDSSLRKKIPLINWHW